MKDILHFISLLAEFDALSDDSSMSRHSESIMNKTDLNKFVYPFFSAKPEIRYDNTSADSIRTLSLKYYKEFYRKLSEMNILSQNPMYHKHIFADLDFEYRFRNYIFYLMQNNYLEETNGTFAIKFPIPLISGIVLGTIIKTTHNQYENINFNNFSDIFTRELQHVIKNVNIFESSDDLSTLILQGLKEFHKSFITEGLANNYSQYFLLKEIMKYEQDKKRNVQDCFLHYYIFSNQGSIEYNLNAIKILIEENLKKYIEIFTVYLEEVSKRFVNNKIITTNESQREKSYKICNKKYTSCKDFYNNLFPTLLDKIYEVLEKQSDTNNYYLMEKDIIFHDYRTLLELILSYPRCLADRINLIINDSNLEYEEKTAIIRSIFKYHVTKDINKKEFLSSAHRSLETALIGFVHLQKKEPRHMFTSNGTYYFETEYLINKYFEIYQKYHLDNLSPANVFSTLRDYENYYQYMQNLLPETSRLEDISITKQLEENFSPFFNSLTSKAALDQIQNILDSDDIKEIVKKQLLAMKMCLIEIVQQMDNYHVIAKNLSASFNPKETLEKLSTDNINNLIKPYYDLYEDFISIQKGNYNRDKRCNMLLKNIQNCNYYQKNRENLPLLRTFLGICL